MKYLKSFESSSVDMDKSDLDLIKDLFQEVVDELFLTKRKVTADRMENINTYLIILVNHWKNSVSMTDHAEHRIYISVILNRNLTQTPIGGEAKYRKLFVDFVDRVQSQGYSVDLSSRDFVPDGQLNSIRHPVELICYITQN